MGVEGDGFDGETFGCAPSCPPDGCDSCPSAATRRGDLKLVQLCQVDSKLFGLDGEGKAWVFDPDNLSWVPVPMRKL